MIDTCPHCKADLRGEPIPEEYRENHGNATHFSRVMGIYDFDRDRTVSYKCPDCGKQWERE